MQKIDFRYSLWIHQVDLMGRLFFLFADFPKERVPVVLAPLLYPETQDISPDK